MFGCLETTRIFSENFRDYDAFSDDTVIGLGFISDVVRVPVYVDIIIFVLCPLLTVKT